jgi:bifunctional DNA-binding transcriptional regulator/antitoxin component of YhaV-PrlF toxin-antitoxin module
MVEFKTHIKHVDGQVWYCAVFVPAEIAKQFIDKKQKRVVCTINNAVTFQCALMPKGDGSYFINTNKEIRKKLGLEPGMEVNIGLEADTSKYGMPLPDELKTAWDLDKEAFDVFHSLTIGKQRNLIHIVGKVKSSEVRIKKALVILEYLKSVNGKLDFKELNQAFKEANRKY